MARKKSRFDPIIFYPLQKVKVKQTFGRGRAWKPESIGYVAHTKFHSETLRQNIVVAFIRYGKSGKPRCDFNSLNSTSVILKDTMKEDERNWAEENIVKNPRRADTELEPQFSDTKNLLNFSALDFVGYLAAFSRYLQYLQGNLGGRARSSKSPFRGAVGPAAAVDHFNQMLMAGANRAHFFDAALLQTMVGMLSNMGKVEDIDYFERLLTFFEDKEIRTAYLEHLHIALCNLRQAVSAYSKLTETGSRRAIDKAEKALDYHSHR